MYVCEDHDYALQTVVGRWLVAVFAVCQNGSCGYRVRLGTVRKKGGGRSKPPPSKPQT